MAPDGINGLSTDLMDAPGLTEQKHDVLWLSTLAYRGSSNVSLNSGLWR